MPEFYRLDMPKEEINKTLLTAVLEAQPVVAGNFAALTKDGQIVDSQKTAADFAPATLDRNLTLYVDAASGSDSNDGTSVGNAKRTITGALNALPHDLSGFTATIKLYGGTLTADTYAINEGRKRNGIVCIDGTNMDSGAQIVGDMRLAGRCDWELTNVRLKGNHIDAGNSVVRVETIGGFTMYGENAIDGNSNLQNGILVLSANSTACIYDVTFRDCNIAISTVPAAFQRRRCIVCAVGECSGINNYTGIYASHASLIYDRTTVSLGNIRRVTIYGGLIVDNSGNFVKE